MPVPEEAHEVIDHFLWLADDILPGCIEGLYLVGSIALGDYKPGRSDIDFVVVAGDALSAEELDRLEQVHRALSADIPRPWFDGIYVTWSDLERGPEGIGDVPFTHEGKFARDGGFEANPAVWLTLRNHPCAIRGPSAPRVWHDAATIRRWNIDNLNSYWRDLLSQGRDAAQRAAALESDVRVNRAVAWCVPGVARLHYTIAVGDVTSKSGACCYALDTFPERWSTVIKEAVALRHGEPLPSRDRASRFADVLDFMEFVIEDAGRSHPDHQPSC